MLRRYEFKPEYDSDEPLMDDPRGPFLNVDDLRAQLEEIVRHYHDVTADEVRRLIKELE